MTWSKNENEPESPEVIFTSDNDGADTDEILFALWVVVQRMAQRRNEDGATGALRLHLSSNATNGYVDVAWADDSLSGIGKWRYSLRLPELHRASLAHDEGAFYFDNQVRFTAFSLAEDLGCLLDGDGLRQGTSARAQAALALSIPAEQWEVFFSTELSDAPEEIIP